MPQVPTIFALASAPGRAGVAVVRVSGPSAGRTVDALAGKRPAARHASLRTLRDPATRDPIDNGLVLWLPAPGTFTGEDTAEFQIHGGPAVIRSLLAALAAQPGCRMAEPGEFARRAFANGRIDLTAAEGLADLIDAETEAQRRQALSQSDGALARLYDGWRSRLIDASALLTAAIDFSDESDVSDAAAIQALGLVQSLASDLDHHLADAHRGEILRDGFRVALLGAPNAGKSSLLNALARREAAIVSPEAGTTRDVVEVRLDLGGLPVIVADTAGLRPEASAGTVEREGMRRSLDHARSADLVLWLDDGSITETPGLPPNLIEAKAPVVVVATKSDLGRSAKQQAPAAIAISAVTGAGLDTLQREIARLAAERTGTSANPEAPVITRLRHRQHVEAATEALSRFLAEDPAALELRAEDLRIAAHEIGRLTGRVDVEDVLDAVFSRFCIGK